MQQVTSWIRREFDVNILRSVADPTSPLPTPPPALADVVVEAVSPVVDGGLFPACRTTADPIVVEADVFLPGHDLATAVVRWRRRGGMSATQYPMTYLDNDRWRVSFREATIGDFEFEVAAWPDPVATWIAAMQRVVDAGVALDPNDVEAGARLIDAAAARAAGDHQSALRSAAAALRNTATLVPSLASIAIIAARYPDPESVTEATTAFPVRVERPLAGSSAWYEFFPRSTGPAGEHGTLRDAAARLPDVAAMGFDIVYLPPIHPIGATARKGPNNAVVAPAGAPGSPWAIGSSAGGHTAIHPDLGTLDDFDAFVAAASTLDLEVALDLAFQCAPDHPWVAAHPDWFVHRPDGTIKTAENPPKRYEDIYPINFATADRDGLWAALLGVVEFWIARGIRVFRVDNPHTKPFTFWVWLINEVRQEHPDIIFLSEAFTRPKVMHQLAKIGFTQSYTYFTWRETAAELRAYVEELNHAPEHDYFRPNFWPNTPDILPPHLQRGDWPIFATRLALAACLSPNYGIYGPAFELREHTPRMAGTEEYLDSEKYEIRSWDLSGARPMVDLITRINAIRRAHPALGRSRNLRFHDVDNDALLCWSVHDPEAGDTVIVVVNVEARTAAEGWTNLDLYAFGLVPDADFTVHDQLSGERHHWRGAHNFVRLDPTTAPAHIFVVESASES